MSNLIELYTKLVDHFGSQKATANALGIGQSAVNDMCSGKIKMRPITAAKAQEATGGKFSAEALCPELKEVMSILKPT